MLSSREADEHRCRQGKSPFIFKDNIRRNDEEEDGLTEEWIEEERLSSGSDAFASGDGSGGKLQSTSLEYQSVRIKDAPSSRNSFGDGNTADNMNNGQVPGGDNGINFGDHLDDLFGGNMTRGSSAARRGGQQLTSLFERHPPPSYNEQMFILGDGREGLEDDQGQEEDLATAAENVSFDVSLINDHINNFMDTPYHHESADEVDDDWHNRRNVVSSSSSSKIPVPSHQTSYDSTTRRRLSELVSEVVSVDYIPNKSGAKRFKVSNEELTVEGEEEQQQEQDERKDRLQHHQPPLQEINQAFDQVNNYTIDYPSDIDFLDDIPREIDNLNNTINHSQGKQQTKTIFNYCY